MERNPASSRKGCKYRRGGAERRILRDSTQPSRPRKNKKAGARANGAFDSSVGSALMAAIGKQFRDQGPNKPLILDTQRIKLGCRRPRK